MNKTARSTRWHPTRLPDLVIAKRRSLWQFSLWDLCCIMALTGLAFGLTLWSYRHGNSWELAFVIWSIIAGSLVFALYGRVVRIMVVTLVLFGVGMLAVSWYLGLNAAIDYEIEHSPTYYWGEDQKQEAERQWAKELAAAEIRRLKTRLMSGGITPQQYEQDISDEGLTKFPH
jgi:hypothetical protein